MPSHMIVGRVLVGIFVVLATFFVGYNVGTSEICQLGDIISTESDEARNMIIKQVVKKPFSAADIFNCYSRKSTCVTNQIYNGSFLFKPQCETMPASPTSA